MGLIVFGKIESGQMKKGQKVLVMPDRRPVVIESILHQEREVDHAVSGDNVKVKIKNAEEDVSTSKHAQYIWRVLLLLIDNECVFFLDFIFIVFHVNKNKNKNKNKKMMRKKKLMMKKKKKMMIKKKKIVIT